MLRWIANLLYGHSDNRELLVATLAVLVKEMGGSAVITLDQLASVDLKQVEVTRNDAPEGVRIFVRDVRG